MFPLGIYNGETRWRAALRLSDLLADPGAGLAAFQPNFRYHLFDQGRIPQDQVRRADNTVSSLLRLEGVPSVETLRGEVARLERRLRHPDHASLRRAFTVWIHRIALPRVQPDAPIPELDDLQEIEQEIESMLAKRVETWTQQWKREGKEEGRAEGRTEGRVLVVQRQLTRRFGPLPEAVSARLAAASVEELDTWADRLLDAATLDEVFAPPAH